MVRNIDLDEGCVVRIAEDNSLDNDAGVVVWDAALVLVNYLSLLQQRSQGAWLFKTRCHPAPQQNMTGVAIIEVRIPPCCTGAWLQGKRVIDVGCGTGVAGLCAAALGAAGVVLTDLPHLVPLAERNIQVRAPCTQHPAELARPSWTRAPQPAAPGCCGDCGLWAVQRTPNHMPARVLTSFCPRRLARCPALPQLNNLQGVASTAALQWGQPVGHLGPPFDLVLASDVIYKAALIQPLLATLRELSGPRTLLLLAAEHREKLPFPQGAFAAAGLNVQCVPHSELHPTGAATTSRSTSCPWQRSQPLRRPDPQEIS